MLSAAFLLSVGFVQAAPAAAAPADDPAYVEDPFLIEEEPVSAEPAAAPPAVAAAEAAEAAEPSPDRIICRSRPELNTRTRYLRVCMTAAEWAHHAFNMEQQRRDINDWGAQGGAGPGQ